MAIVRKVVRVANPRRSSRTKRNNGKRRRMTAKQIRHFGTKRQRAALKRRTSGKRRASNPRPRVRAVSRRRTTARRRTHRRMSNPGLVVTLGSINPRKRRTSVAKTRKRRRKSNPRASRRRTRRVVRHHRRRRANRRTVVITRNPRRRRRSNPRRRHMRRYSRRRNPGLFGQSGGKSMLTMVGGGLVGVTVTKMLPRYLPSSLVGALGSGGIMAVLLSGASAWVAGWAASKVNRQFGEAVLFGGLMQTGSVALNTFLPNIGGQFSLGDLIAGNFVVPQNPIRSAMGGGAMAPSGMGSAAFPRAF